MRHHDMVARFQERSMEKSKARGLYPCAMCDLYTRIQGSLENTRVKPFHSSAPNARQTASSQVDSIQLAPLCPTKVEERERRQRQSPHLARSNAASYLLHNEAYLSVSTNARKNAPRTHTPYVSFSMASLSC